MKQLVMTTYKRVDYLKETLASLEKNSNLEDYVLNLFCEPGFPEVIKVCQNIKFIKRIIAVNPVRLGVRNNPFCGLKKVFDLGATSALYLEDDVLLSPDALKLYEFYLTLPEDPSNICLNIYNHNSAPDADPVLITKKRDFSSLCIGMKKFQWDNYFAKSWFHPSGWDFGPTKLLNENPDLYTWQPKISRSHHIGLNGGTHYVPSQHDHIYKNNPWHQGEPVDKFEIKNEVV